MFGCVWAILQLNDAIFFVFFLAEKEFDDLCFEFGIELDEVVRN